MVIAFQSSFFTRLYLRAEEHPRLIVSLSLVFLAIAGWGLNYSKLELDIYDVYDQNFQSSVDLFDLKESFRDNSQLMVVFSFSEEPNAGSLCKLLRWSRDLSAFHWVNGINSVWSVRKPQRQGERLLYPTSLPDPCNLPSGQTVDYNSSLSEGFFRHLIPTTGTKDVVFDVSLAGSGGTAQVQNLIDYTDAYVGGKLRGVIPKYLGSSASRYYFKRIMFRDSIFNLVILMLMIIFMRMIYGTWRSGFFLCLTLIAANVVLYGVMGWLSLPVNILTCNLFLMTAVAATADFMFVTHAQLRESYRDSLLHLIKPCFLTTLTTIVGFISLNTSDITIIRQFGNAAALGALAEWAVMFLCLPAFLRSLGRETVWVDEKKAASVKLLERLERLKIPPQGMWLLMLLMLLSLPAFFHLNDQDSPVENLPTSHILRKGYEDFKRKFQWEGLVYLYFPEEVSSSQYKGVIDKLRGSSQIFRIEDPEELAVEWTSGLPSLKQALVRRELTMSPLWRRYYSARGQLRIPLYLYEQDLWSLRELKSKVQEACASLCRLAGQRVVYLEYGEKITRTMIESFGVSIFLVLVILGWLLKLEGKFRYFLPVAVSSLMGPLVTLTLISLFQIPVTLVTSIFLAVMVGLAGDNAIQYLLASDADLMSGVENRSRASIMVTLVMIAASSMFLLQTLLPMKILGLLFILGFVINLAGDLWGLKSLLSRPSKNP